MTAAVRTTGLDVRFETERGPVQALSGIDLDIAPGAFVSLIGPSGCGKSTLLRCIGDLVQPTAGEVTVGGLSAHEARLAHRYGIAFQSAGLLDWRSVQRNVELPLELHGVGRRERAARARELLELVGLGDVARSRPAELSGGMQMRVAIARALAEEPPLLLMDEPFGALDEMTREHLQAELLRLCERTGTTVVFVTHSIAEAVFLSTQVVVMSARPGRVVRVVDVDLPGRDEDAREHPAYFAAITEVREALRGRSGPPVAPSTPAARSAER
ncbi:ABC transporter ATP-binding protein [Kineococcus terrestris]|uniref:ABC transporter ATP-binding protein n=1 Tax=Kineococcus terrestris TaxID=2044856 RepID=UPI0034DAD48B